MERAMRRLRGTIWTSELARSNVDNFIELRRCRPPSRIISRAGHSHVKTNMEISSSPCRTLTKLV